MSPLQTAERQTWRSDDGSVTFNGCQLMRRLVEIGARKAIPATLDELLAIPVGGSGPRRGTWEAGAAP